MIETGALDLKGHCLLSKAAITEIQQQGFAAIAEVKLGPMLFHQPGGFQFGQHPHRFEDSMIVWQQRFADVESRKMFLFQQEHFLSRSRQKSGSGTSSRPTANYYRVITSHSHEAGLSNKQARQSNSVSCGVVGQGLGRLVRRRGRLALSFVSAAHQLN